MAVEGKKKFYIRGDLQTFQLFSELTEPLVQPLLIHVVPPFENGKDLNYCLQINGNVLWEWRTLEGNLKKLFAVLQMFCSFVLRHLCRVLLERRFVMIHTTVLQAYLTDGAQSYAFAFQFTICY